MALRRLSEPNSAAAPPAPSTTSASSPAAETAAAAAAAQRLPAGSSGARGQARTSFANGFGGSAKRAGRRPLSLHRQTGYAVAGAVLLWLLLQYVVEVRVTLRWRSPATAQPAADQRVAAAAAAAAAARVRAAQQRHCSNTCFKARDGVCDEGRPTPSRPNPHASEQELQQWRQWEQRRLERLPELVAHVACDLGTDCDDCGAWNGHQAHPDWDEPQLPIAFLASRGVAVRSRPFNARSAAPLAGLRFAYVDPLLDVDVSHHMESSGLVEVGISQIFYTVLSGRCNASADGGAGGAVADVGANFGYFSVLAARLGCRVYAWEPVPAFRALLSFNLAANGLTGATSIRPTVVAHPPGSTQVVVAPNRGIWGTAGIGGDNLDTGITNDGAYDQVRVVADSLDEVLEGQHVLLLKVDVEGYEPSVMATASQLLASGSVDNIVLEYTPGVLERTARWDEMWVPPTMLLNLTAAGFHLSWLPDTFVRVWSEARHITSPLPALRSITPDNLAHDLWDARVYRTGVFDSSLATPFCAAMADLGMANWGVPERLHPKSFHSMFSHNTNVWASRDAKLLASRGIAGPPVGVVPPGTPTNASWFVPPGQDMGLGAVSCRAMAAEYAAHLGLGQQQQEGGADASAPSPRPQVPPHEVAAMMSVLIGRRCRCTHGLPCKKHEEVVEHCTRTGQTPYKDLL